MMRMMKPHGITEAQLNSKAFRTTRYITPPERNHAGIVERDYPYRFIKEVSP
jgi:hypothetical protein